MRGITLAFAFVMSLALATSAVAQDAPRESKAVNAAAESAKVSEAGAGAVETATGSCVGCNGWVWAHTKECWRYVSGSEERIWLYFNEALPANAQVDTGDARHKLFIEACSSAHWLGTFWTGNTTFTNVRLWFN
jgi:hypothetical protein